MEERVEEETRLSRCWNMSNRHKLLEEKFCQDIKSILHSKDTQMLDILPSEVLELHLRDVLKT